MYTYLLSLHSWFRWLVIINLIIVFIFLWIHKSRSSVFTSQHYVYIKISNIILTIQLLVGIALFIYSPIATNFWKQVPESLSWRQVRFFGLEHPFMMLLGVILSNYFTYKLQFKLNTVAGFTYLFKRHFIILLIIFSSIPWALSPLTSRPNFRM